MSESDHTYRPDEQPGAATSRPPADEWVHPVNIGHLVLGIAFLGIVLVWALVVGDAVTGDDVRWLWPIPWVAAGGAGLVAIVVSARRR